MSPLWGFSIPLASLLSASSCPMEIHQASQCSSFPKEHISLVSSGARGIMDILLARRQGRLKSHCSKNSKGSCKNYCLASDFLGDVLIRIKSRSCLKYGTTKQYHSTFA
ncbi:hypothetical protein CRYUN_Cryun31cG0074300 [Craigia yunnanensis]